jgi:linoleoyl-CoA desaturase
MKHLPALEFNQQADRDFSVALKNSVHNYLQEKKDHRFSNTIFLLKLLALAIIAYTFYFFALNSHSMMSYGILFVAFMWFAMLLSMNASHDASHGSVFRSPSANRWLMALCSIPMGTDPDFWTLRHVHFHHTYPNIQHYDLDMEPNLALRQAPFHDWAPQYNYQRYYWPLVAAISLTYLCWVSDWLDRFGKTPLNKFAHLNNKTYWLKFLSLKVAHIFLLIVIPGLVLAIPFWQILIVYLIAQMLVSAFLVLMILGTHWADVDFFQADNENKIPHSWHRHAFLTACDWQPNPRWINYFLGGLDLHLTHHLLPSYSNLHYTAIADIIKNLSQEYDLPYRRISYPELVKEQQGFLKKMGENPEKQLPETRKSNF